MPYRPFYVPKNWETYDKLVEIAIQEGKSVSDKIREAIEFYLNKHYRPKNQTAIPDFNHPPAQGQQPNWCDKCMVFFCVKHQHLHINHRVSFRDVGKKVCAHCK